MGARMEPTIYKPSIYKGAGIYKAGAEGGGGGGDIDKSIFSVLYPTSEYRYIIFEEKIEKQDLSILLSFSRSRSSECRFLKLYDESDNQIGQIVSSSSSVMYVNNATGSYGDSVSVSAVNTVIMRNGAYNFYREGTKSSFGCPWANSFIKKISFGFGFIYRFAMFKGGIDINDNSEFIVDMRPAIVNGENGVKDIVNNKFYKLEQVSVY